MSLLNQALNLKMAGSQVSAAYQGNVRVWPSGEGLWEFNIPPDGAELQLRFITSDGSPVIINWGDSIGNETIPNNVVTSHTYDFSTNLSTWTGAVDIVSDPLLITDYESVNNNTGPWVSSQRFFGKTDVSILENLQKFRVSNHGVEVVGLESLTEVRQWRNVTNDSIGKPLEDLSNKPDLSVYNVYFTKYLGPVHSQMPSDMLRYVITNNNHTGVLPDFDLNFNGSGLQYYLVGNNNLTGEIPSLALMGNNYTATPILGESRFDFSFNGFTGLRDINTWTVNNRIDRLYINHCNLDSASIDKIITQMDIDGPQMPSLPGGALQLSLNGNPGTPSQSVIDVHVASLTSKGFVVQY